MVRFWHKSQTIYEKQISVLLISRQVINSHYFVPYIGTNSCYFNTFKSQSMWDCINIESSSEKYTHSPRNIITIQSVHRNFKWTLPLDSYRKNTLVRIFRTVTGGRTLPHAPPRLFCVFWARELHAPPSPPWRWPETTAHGGNRRRKRYRPPLTDGDDRRWPTATTAVDRSTVSADVALTGGRCHVTAARWARGTVLANRRLPRGEPRQPAGCGSATWQPAICRLFYFLKFKKFEKSVF